MSRGFLLSIALGFAGAAAFAGPLRPNRWTVPTYRGNTERIVFADGIPKVLVFLSAKCAPSREQERHLTDLAAEFREFRFFGIHASADEDTPAAEAHFRALPFAVVRDPYGQLADATGATATPHAVIVGADGRVRYRGAVIDPANETSGKKFRLRNALMDMSRGEDVDQSPRDSSGCRIVRTVPPKPAPEVPMNLGTY